VETRDEGGGEKEYMDKKFEGRGVEFGKQLKVKDVTSTNVKGTRRKLANVELMSGDCP